MKKLILLLIGILLYSCGPSRNEIAEKQPYIHTVTHPYELELLSGQTFTKNICTRANDGGEDYLNFKEHTGSLLNYWNVEVAAGIKSFKRILVKDTVYQEQLRQHMLSIDGIVVDLPEEWMAISNTKYRQSYLLGYISGDTLYISFTH